MDPEEISISRSANRNHCFRLALLSKIIFLCSRQYEDIKAFFGLRDSVPTNRIMVG